MAPTKSSEDPAITSINETLIINETKEIHQTSTYSAAMPSPSTNAKTWPKTHPHGTKSQGQTGWETVKMVLTFRRPPCFPSLSMQREFRARIRETVNGNLDALRLMPAPSMTELEIPEGASFDNMLDGGTSSVSPFTRNPKLARNR